MVSNALATGDNFRSSPHIVYSKAKSIGVHVVRASILS